MKEEASLTSGPASAGSRNNGKRNLPKTFFFQICRLDGGFLILILSYVASPQCRTIFQVSHSVSASSAPYRLSDALNRHIPGLKSTLLLRRRKKIDGLEIHRTPARRATDALRRHLAHGFDILLPERRKDLPFSLNVLGMGFDTAQMEKADVVHLHWIGGRTVDFSQLRHIRRPLVYTLHDMFACTAGCHCTMDCDRFRDECRGSCPQLGTPRLFRSLPAWLFSRKRRSFARIPSLTLVTPSLWLKREVEKGCMFPGRRIVQIYNPVDTDLFRPAEDREAIRAAIKTAIEDNNIRILLVFPSHTEGGTEIGRRIEFLCEDLVEFSKLHSDRSVRIKRDERRGDPR